MPTINRSLTTLVVERANYVRTYCNGTVQPESSSVSLSPTTSATSKVWSRTANYRALVRARARLPDLPFSYSRYNVSTNEVVYRINSGETCGPQWNTRSLIGQYTLFPCRYISVDGGVQKLSSNGVIARLLEKARGAEFQAPVFFAEARQTGDMVLSSARTLASSFRSLRRGDLVGAMRQLGLGAPTREEFRRFNRRHGRDAWSAASNRWLELQYGWKPLLNDVKNAAETLAETQADSSSTVGTVRSYQSLETVDIDSDFQVEISPPGFARKTRRQTESWKGCWRFSPTGLSTVASLGLLNPLSVAWELTYLSFVIDWFLPIGRYLETLDSSFRFTHVGGSLGYRREVHSYFENFRRSGIPGSGTYESHHFQVTRTPFTQIPSLGLNSIRFEPHLGASRVLSGLALASQAFRR